MRLQGDAVFRWNPAATGARLATMTETALTYSPDQAEAHDRIAEALRGVGVDLDEGTLSPPREGAQTALAVIGKAGSGKTLLLAAVYRALREAGVEIVSGDYEGRKRRDQIGRAHV